MQRRRVIPVLQIENRKMVKASQFKNPIYLGDPINALRIFNEKQVDEVAVVDIGATAKGKSPDIEFIKELAGECFMPLSYGGGISNMEEAMKLFEIGVEKLIIGTSFLKNPQLVRDISERFGSQSVMVCIDVKKNWLGSSKVYVKNGTLNTGYTPAEYAKMAQSAGAGEVLLKAMDKENMANGYDLSLIKEVCEVLQIPLVACGGASNVQDFCDAIGAGASGVAAGSMFVFKGRHQAVLINYPDQETLVKEFYNKL